jgi:hypothetical protein
VTLRGWPHQAGISLQESIMCMTFQGVDLRGASIRSASRAEVEAVRAKAGVAPATAMASERYASRGGTGSPATDTSSRSRALLTGAPAAGPAGAKKTLLGS